MINLAKTRSSKYAEREKIIITIIIAIIIVFIGINLIIHSKIEKNNHEIENIKKRIAVKDQAEVRVDPIDREVFNKNNISQFSYDNKTVGMTLKVDNIEELPKFQKEHLFSYEVQNISIKYAGRYEVNYVCYLK